MNTLMIMPDPSKKEFFIASYTGETGMGEKVVDEVAHDIIGNNKNDIIINAAIIWGVDLESCTIDFQE